MINKHYTDIKITPLPDKELEIIGSITAEKMARTREKALRKFKETLEMPGFRKGNVPEAMVAGKIGEMKLIEEAAEIALSEEYPNILEEYKIDPIGRPEIAITKIGVGSALEFKVKTALMPEVKLGDYKKIAKQQRLLTLSVSNILEVNDNEVDRVIKNIRYTIAHENLDKAGDVKHTHPETKSRSELGSTTGIKDEDLPPIDDNFAKMVGEFKTVDEMRAKIKENIAKEKELKEKDKRRIEIIEEIIKTSTIELPKIIIDGELEKMLAQLKDDLAKNGLPYEDYLRHIKKTEEDLRIDWKKTATKRAETQIILNTIAKDEGIITSEEEIKKEMNYILAHFKNTDRFRVRMYVETFLTNELVFQFLESQK